jgi:hypothetical protein
MSATASWRRLANLENNDSFHVLTFCSAQTIALPCYTKEKKNTTLRNPVPRYPSQYMSIHHIHTQIS